MALFTNPSFTVDIVNELQKIEIAIGMKHTNTYKRINWQDNVPKGE